MENAFCPYENALFGAIDYESEYLPEGRTVGEVWVAGGKLLARGDCGSFVFLFGRQLAAQALPAIREIGDEECTKMLEKAIARGASLYDSQGKAGLSELRTAAGQALHDKEAAAWLRVEAALVIGVLLDGSGAKV